MSYFKAKMLTALPRSPSLISGVLLLRDGRGNVG